MRLSNLIVSLIGVAFLAVPAAAQPTSGYIFGYSSAPYWTLTVNDAQIFYARDTGWIDSTGSHIAENSNYIAAFNYNDRGYNNWALFDLAALSAPVTSAFVTINTFEASGSGLRYTLFDTSARLELDAERAAGDVLGQSLFADLGSGTFYGDRVYSIEDSDENRQIQLSPAALSDIGTAAGGTFALGGTLSPAAAVPEMSSWSMMIVGLGGIGCLMRRRTAAFAGTKAS